MQADGCRFSFELIEVPARRILWVKARLKKQRASSSLDPGMLEDRSYMRASPFSSRLSAAVLLLIINTAAFVLQMVLERFTSLPIHQYFALSLAGLKHGYVWQLVTFQLMHAGWLHLLLNCWIIYVFGRDLEENLGRKAFWTLYFGTGILGGLTQLAMGLLFGGPFAASVVGASAGAFGLLAAFAVLAPERPLTLLLFFILPVTLKAKVLLLIEGLVALIGVVMPTGNVAHAAHLGGMLGGIMFVRYGLRLSWRMSTFRLPRRKESSVVKLRVQKQGFWPRGKTIEAEDLPASEFLSKEVDPILDKISAQGIQSLTERERRILEKARSKVAHRP